ncbi:MAG: hypothetical protein ACI311_02220 [Bacilli bacterium]
MKKFNIREHLHSLVLLCLGFVLSLMVFLPGGKQVYQIGEESVVNTITGLKYTFGGETQLNIGKVNLKFNPFAFFGFFLPLFISIIYFVLDVCFGKKANLMILIVVFTYVLSFLFLIFSAKVMVAQNGLGDEVVPMSQSYKLGIGSIFGVTLNFVGVVSSLAITYIKLVK